MVPQGSVLGPLFFSIYINDLCKCVNHFADDTNMLLSHSSLETLAKQMNSDLKNLSQWLKANKLSLHVMKTELIIFHSSSKKTDRSLKIILDGKRLIQPDTVKYIGVLLDQGSKWRFTICVSRLVFKFSRITFLEKLRKLRFKKENKYKYKRTNIKAKENTHSILKAKEKTDASAANVDVFNTNFFNKFITKRMTSKHVLLFIRFSFLLRETPLIFNLPT